tara:strand:+ start:6809 stop:7831 length:1023 start_codon:yes stop_codon:yes gene_type:complete
MTDEEAVTASEKITTDADQEEIEEILTLDQRKEELKKSRWNVFLWLGIAVLMFTFALFPMPFSAGYDDFTHSVEKDIGFVWGPSLPGDDLFDAPLHLEVLISSPPTHSEIRLDAYVIKQNNCQQNLGVFTEEAKLGTNHAYQYQSVDTLIEDEEYTFKFSVDPGQYCVIIQYFNETSGEVDKTSSNDMSVKGKMWPNQVIGGIFGIICLSLSAFAFIGAQKHGAHVKSILENGDESTEDKVLASLTGARVAAGPTGAPPSAGPTGGPPSAGPPEAVEVPVAQTPAEPVEEITQTAPEPVSSEAIFEPAEGGYFFKKLPDGTYEQTVYVQNADGSYTPHEG